MPTGLTEFVIFKTPDGMILALSKIAADIVSAMYEFRRDGKIHKYRAAHLMFQRYILAHPEGVVVLLNDMDIIPGAMQRG